MNISFNSTKNEILKIIEILNTKETNKNFTKLNYISTSGCTLIKTFCEKSKENLDEYLFTPKVKLFLENQGFFDNSKRIITAGNILPFITINTSNEVENNTSLFKKKIQEYANINGQLLNTISTIIGELLQNISDHSGMHQNSVYNYSSGHYLPSHESFKIAITDAGKGIFASLRKKYKDLDNAGDAIKKALIPKISGGRDFDKSLGYDQDYTANRGIGLSKTFEAIKQLKGDLFIGTKDFLYSYTEEEGEMLQKIPNGQKWVGTFVIFNIYKNINLEIDIEKIDENLMGSGCDLKNIDKKEDIDNMFL